MIRNNHPNLKVHISEKKSQTIDIHKKQKQQYQKSSNHQNNQTKQITPNKKNQITQN